MPAPEQKKKLLGLTPGGWMGTADAGFTHETPRAGRDGKLRNRTSPPALGGTPAAKPERVFAELTSYRGDLMREP